MIELGDLGSWREYADATRAGGRVVGLVPTMGALHEGHVSLVRAARERGDVVLLTIFVNPRQFNDAADLAHYPRDLERDREIAERAGVDALVVPTLEEMWPGYPHPVATTVHVAGLGDIFEGVGRPGHFDGVASVVAKLCHVTGPSRAYFGEKDFQQVAVIRQMVSDLAMPVDVVACALVRDADGLALSSRNVRLSPSGRERALSMSRVLAEVSRGAWRVNEARERLRGALRDAGCEVAYADVVEPSTLRGADERDEGEARALLAITVDGVRLIDNGPITLRGGH